MKVYPYIYHGRQFYEETSFLKGRLFSFKQTQTLLGHKEKQKNDLLKADSCIIY